MSSEFDVPTEISDVTIIGPLPLPVSGTISTSPDVNVHDAAGNPITSTGTSLNVDVTNSVPVTGPLTDAQLRASAVGISATSLPLPTGASTEATLALIKAKTDNLDVALSTRTKPADTQTISGTVTVSNPGLTDTQLRASPVPISGTVTATPTGTQDVNIIGTTVTQPISGTVTANAGTNLNTSLLALDSTLTNATQKTKLVDSSGVNLASVSAAGAVKVDGSAATQPVSGSGNFTVVQSTGTNLHTTVDNFPATQPVSGTVTAIQGTGTNLHTVLDSGTLTSITNALPAGTNVIGHVIADSGSTTVVTGNVTVVQPTGTNLHTVLDSGTLTGALPAGSNVIGHTISDSGSTTVVTGNVTVVQGTGTNLHTVIDSGTLTAVTAITNALPAGSNVIGHVIADSGSTTAVTGNVTVVQGTGTNLHAVIDSGSTTAVTGNVTVVQSTGTNLHAVIDSGSTTAVTGNVTVVQSTASNLKVDLSGTGANATALKVDGSAVTQPVNQVGSTTATLSNVGSSATNVTLLASNASRKMAIVFNDSSKILYLKFGATASTSSYTVQIAPNSEWTFSLPIYTGQVDGVWSAANGNARLTEY